MAYGRGKRDNEYARLVFDIDAPKTVWMAIAVAFADRLIGTGPDGQLQSVSELIRREWELLHQNGIVPQKPR